MISEVAPGIARGVSIDANDAVYVVADDSFIAPGQPAWSEGNAYLQKYDTAPALQWSTQVGASSTDYANAVSVDAAGSVYVAGETNVTPGELFSASKAFLRKYDASGSELWTRQFGSSGQDRAFGTTADASGNAYVVGLTGAPTVDAFVSKYDGSGTELWNRQFGSQNEDLALGVSVDASGNVHVAGQTNGPLPGQTFRGNYDAFLRTYDASGNELWTRQFGSSGADAADRVGTDAEGNVYIVGTVSGDLPGQTGPGGFDAFVRKYDASGNEVWTRQFGTGGADGGSCLRVAPNGDVVLAGNAAGVLSGETGFGDGALFVRKYDASGVELWTRQFGSGLSPGVRGIDVDSALNVYLVGRLNLKGFLAKVTP